MPERIVQRFEVIEIDEHEGGADLVLPAGHHRLPQPIQKQRAIGQARKRVIEGKFPDLLLRLLALRDIAAAGTKPDEVALLIADRNPGDRQPEDRSILAHATKFEIVAAKP